VTKTATSTYVTKWPEEAVLDYFWRASSDLEVDRLELLQQLAGVAIARPADWDYEALRDVNQWEREKPSTGCFSCRTWSRRLYWHHVIELQHGGSNDRRNLIPICYRCHCVIHPWLPERTDAEEQWREGWTAIAEVAAKTVACRDDK